MHPHTTAEVSKLFSVSGCRWYNGRLYPEIGGRVKPKHDKLSVSLRDGGKRSYGPQLTADCFY